MMILLVLLYVFTTFVIITKNVEMNQRTQMLNHAMTYGLVMGVVFFLNFFLGTLNNGVASATQWIITCTIPCLLYVIERNCRDKVCEGKFSYRQGLWYGVQIFFYGSLIAGAFKYVYLRWIRPNYLNDLFNQIMQLLDTLKYPVTDEMVEATRLLLTPINMVGQYIWMDVLIGLLVSLVMASILKREDPFENVEKEDKKDI